MSQRVLNPDACAFARSAPEAISSEAIPPQATPLDQLLSRAIAALSVCDAAGLRDLEALAPQAAMPLDWERCRKLRAVYAALLAATARNLRMARRAEMGGGAVNRYRPVNAERTARH